MILDRIVYDKRLYLESAKKVRPADQFDVSVEREHRSLTGSIEAA